MDNMYKKLHKLLKANKTCLVLVEHLYSSRYDRIRLVTRESCSWDYLDIRICNHREFDESCFIEDLSKLNENKIIKNMKKYDKRMSLRITDIYTIK